MCGHRLRTRLRKGGGGGYGNRGGEGVQLPKVRTSPPGLGMIAEVNTFWQKTQPPKRREESRVDGKWRDQIGRPFP
jgi:hypothetical protein